MELKKYRVLCWQPADARIEDPVFIDIAPENGVIHNMMFYSRLKLYRGTNPNKNIKNIAGSIYLSVSGEKEPEVTFTQSSPDMQRRLLPQILNTYKKMHEAGKETTINSMISVWEAEMMSDEFMSSDAKAEAKAFEHRTQKRRNLFSLKHPVKTFQEERIQEEKIEFISSLNRRRSAMEHRASQDSEINPIERMRQRMRQYDGD